MNHSKSIHHNHVNLIVIYCTFVVIVTTCTMANRLLAAESSIPIELENKLPYQNPVLPVAERVSDLLGRMTLDEKVQQLCQIQLVDITNYAETLAKFNPGMISVSSRLPLEWNREQFEQIQEYLRFKTRLGIPTFFGAEGLHGLMLESSTIYPQAIGLGATWDTKLVKQAATEIAEEASAVGVSQILAPVLDLGRDPRYGRIEECYGECPTLVSQMGKSYITGLQGDNAQLGLATNKVFSMIKHFGGYSVPANGINVSPVLIGERELRTHHFIPFEAAVREAHVMAVMPCYPSVDSVPSHQNRWLLTEILRNEWGFLGYIYSDWGGVNMAIEHRIARNKAEAAQLSLNAGVDIEAPSPDCFFKIPALIQSNQINLATLDQAVSYVLRAKFLAGLFDDRRVSSAMRVQHFVHTPEHIGTSRKLADEGIILLKNEGLLLPLDAGKIKSIALIGPHADQVQFGDYAWTQNNEDGVTVLAALKEKYADRFKIRYAKGCDLVKFDTTNIPEAVKAAKRSDVAVVVVGDSSVLFAGVGWTGGNPFAGSATSGEMYDMNNPVLPGAQEELVKAVVATGKPTIVVLLHARPFCIPWLKENVPAIIDAFCPGEQQGNAIVDLLFGKINPSGHLPVTLVRSAGAIPTTYDYKPDARGTTGYMGSKTNPGCGYVYDSPLPLWPFGFGLSYTTFEFGKLSVETPQVPAKDGLLKFTIEAANTGAMAGKAVPQIYWRDNGAHIAPPEKRLLRFAKVELQPGERRTLSFEVPVAEFRQLTADKKWILDPRNIELQLGEHAESIQQTNSFDITD